MLTIQTHKAPASHSAFSRAQALGTRGMRQVRNLLTGIRDLESLWRQMLPGALDVVQSRFGSVRMEDNSETDHKDCEGDDRSI